MFSSSFFDAELVGGAYDRVYAASNFAEYFASFIANGVFPDPATNLQIVANTTPNMTVLASTGLGWINGYYCKNSNPYPMAIAAASGSQARIDSIMLRWDKAARNITTYVKMGTPSANPQPPTVERTPDVYELMLATVLVGAGVTKIVQGNITDKRSDTSVCGYVHGVVSQIDTTNLFAQYDEAFQTWFADIQAQLSGDIATNLQNQINNLKNDKLNITAKATTAQAQAGTLDTVYTTPLTTKAHVDYRIPTQAVAEAGSDNTKLMTPLRVKQAIEALEPVGSMKKSTLNLEASSVGKYLFCDGREISLSSYPDFFNASPDYIKNNLSSILLSDTQSKSPAVWARDAVTFASRGVFALTSDQVVYTNTEGTSPTLLLSGALCMCVSDDGNYLFIGCTDGYIRVFNTSFSKLREVKSTGYYVERIVAVGSGVYFSFSHSTNDTGGQLRVDRSSNNFTSLSNCISTDHTEGLPSRDDSHQQLMVRSNSTTIFTCIFGGYLGWENREHQWWVYKSTDNGVTFTKHPTPISVTWYNYGNVWNDDVTACYYLNNELRVVTPTRITCYNPTTMAVLRTLPLFNENSQQSGMGAGVVFNGIYVAIGYTTLAGDSSRSICMFMTDPNWTELTAVIPRISGVSDRGTKYSIVDGMLILSGMGNTWRPNPEDPSTRGSFYTTTDLVNFNTYTPVTGSSDYGSAGAGVFTKVSNFLTSIGDKFYTSTGSSNYQRLNIRMDTTKAKIPKEKLVYLKVKVA